MNIQPAGEPFEREEANLYECSDCDAIFPVDEDETPDTCPQCGGFCVFVHDAYMSE